jgi:hypothetical protein
MVEVTESNGGKTSKPEDAADSKGGHVDVSITKQEVGEKSKLVPAAKRQAEENHDGIILVTIGGISRPFRMLVDTGVKIYVLKLGLIPEYIPIHTDKQYELAGITTGSIKTLGSVHLTLRYRTYVFQAAPEEIQLKEDGLIGRDILKDSIIHNREGYVDISEKRYYFGVKNVKPMILKPRAETIAEVCIDLYDGPGIEEKRDIYPGVYVASSVSQVNNHKTIHSILNTTEEAIEIGDLKVAATKWMDYPVC